MSTTHIYAIDWQLIAPTVYPTFKEALTAYQGHNQERYIRRVPAGSSDNSLRAPLSRDEYEAVIKMPVSESDYQSYLADEQEAISLL